MGKKIPCFLRLHGSVKEHLIEGFDSISKAKKWINDCWNGRPYTIVRLTPKLLLIQHGFVFTSANVYKKNEYVATVYNDNQHTNISKYTPKHKRQLWSKTYDNLNLRNYLKHNHK